MSGATRYDKMCNSVVLTMAEYIEREAALMKLMQHGCSANNLQSISDMPAADVAPVVHCKDCKHYLIADEFDGGKRIMCEVNHFSYLNSDGDMHFCSYGERRDKP